MSNLTKFKESIARAKKVQEAAAAAVAELTREIKPETTTFTFSADGVNYNQLTLEMLKLASPDTVLAKEGDIIRIVTTNPVAATKVLGYLGIDAKVDGVVELDKQDKEVPTA